MSGGDNVNVGASCARYGRRPRQVTQLLCAPSDLKQSCSTVDLSDLQRTSCYSQVWQGSIHAIETLAHSPQGVLARAPLFFENSNATDISTETLINVSKHHK